MPISHLERALAQVENQLFMVTYTTRIDQKDFADMIETIVLFC